MEQANILRVVVASPSDVQAEREIVPRVVEKINKGIGAGRGTASGIGRSGEDLRFSHRLFKRFVNLPLNWTRKATYPREDVSRCFTGRFDV